MTTKLIALSFALVPLFGAQAVDGTYRFTTPQTPQGLQEAATVVRTVADIPQLSVDANLGALNFNGPADNVGLAEWILPLLDRTADTTPHAYPMPKGEVARVIYLPGVKTPRALQELLTVLRTVADIQKVFSYTPGPALALRGTEGQVAFAEWIIDQLALPSDQKPGPAPREFKATPVVARIGTAARINYLQNLDGTRGMQQLFTVLRTVADVQKVFNYTEKNAMVMLGDDQTVSLAEWLIQNLDQPADQPHSGAVNFSAPSGDDVTRIFYIRNTTEQGLNAALSGIRTELKIRKAFYIATPAALIVRGTTDQVEAAASYLANHNGLALLPTEPRLTAARQ